MIVEPMLFALHTQSCAEKVLHSSNFSQYLNILDASVLSKSRKVGKAYYFEHGIKPNHCSIDVISCSGVQKHLREHHLAFVRFAPNHNLFGSLRYVYNTVRGFSTSDFSILLVHSYTAMQTNSSENTICSSTQSHFPPLDEYGLHNAIQKGNLLGAFDAKNLICLKKYSFFLYQLSYC